MPLPTEHQDPEKFAGEGSAVDDLRDLIAKIEAVVPYVTATLGTNNGFPIEQMPKGSHGDPKEWRAVHAGRASSSLNQLNALLAKAQLLKAKIT